jgi:DNA polymerase III gamma/tau subunit
MFFCTTDEQKLIRTLRNRCAELAVKRLDEHDMGVLLKQITKVEEKRISSEARERIIDAAQGSPRHALTILDRIIDLPREEQADAVDSISSEDAEIIDLCRAMIKRKSWTDVREILKTLESISEAEETRRAILGYCKTVCLSGESGWEQARLVMNCFRDPTYNNGWAEIVMSAMDVCLDDN